MPRKKLENSELVTPAAEETLQPTPKKPTRKKSEPVETLVAEPAPAPRKRAAKKAVEPAVEAVPVEPAPEAEPVPKPRARRAPKKAAEPAEAPVVSLVPEELGDGEEIVPIFRPRASASAPDAPGEAAPEPIVVAVEEPEPVFTVLDDERGIELLWRARTGKPVAAPDAPSVEEPKKRGRRDRRGKPEKAVAVVAEPTAEPVVEAFVDGEESSLDFEWLAALGADFPGEVIPVPLWRPRSANAPSKAALAADNDQEVGADFREEDDDSDGRGRKRRRRRGKDRDVEVSAKEPEPEDDAPEAAAAPVLPKKAPEKPAAPVRPILPIPDAAPQIVNRNGMPTLVREGRVYAPLFFAASISDDRRTQAVLDEVRMAAEAGVHLLAVRLEIEVAGSDVTTQALRALQKIVDVDPEAQVLFRVALRAPYGWQDRYAKARYRLRDGSLADPSICDDQYWGDARETLEGFVRTLRESHLRDRILGVHLDRDWSFSHEHGYDESEAAKFQFRAWARTRYVNDEVMLRASWFDGTARFDTINPPPYQPEGAEGERFVRSSRKQRRYVDYHFFLSDMTVQRIGDLAYAVKRASDGYFLVGVSYGYTFEWSHPNNGHLSLGKLLRTPEIDLIAGPPSYRSREPGGTGAFPGPIDSFALNGKMYISEEDFRTSLGGHADIEDHNPELKTPQALETVHWRGAGSALAHGTGVSWDDRHGAGWLKTNSVWDRAAKVIESLVRRMGTTSGDPDVTVFVDERALAYLVDPNAFTLLVQNVREAVLRAGVSAGFYLLSDLAHREKFPESKLYIFLNAWDIRPELRAAIKTRLQRDDKVLFWLYSAGLFDAGRDSLERAREVTGIALKPQPFHSKSGTTIINKRHPLCEAFPDRSVMGATTLEPSYFAIPEDATVLGEYTQTGLPSFVVREFADTGEEGGRWTSVFLGEPQVNPALIRALATMAGCHVWNFTEDTVHVRAPFLTVHCRTAGPRTVALPDRYCAFHVQANQWAAVDTTHLRFVAVEGSTQTFLVGTKEDVTNLIHTDPKEWLKMDELPPREANIRHDVTGFDVPIMRLDEWIEGGESDDVADEWFLRPVVIPEEEPGEEVTISSGNGEDRGGRRRRNRRRGGRGEGYASDPRPEPGSTPVSADDDFSMSVLFRKRD